MPLKDNEADQQSFITNETSWPTCTAVLNIYQLWGEENNLLLALFHLKNLCKLGLLNSDGFPGANNAAERLLSTAANYNNMLPLILLFT